jgi:heavy metal efflux system protein
MMEKLINFALQQRGFIWVLVVALTIAGIHALQNLPIEAFPDVQDVQVQVITQLPGQAPAEIERTVTLPIEREMSGVPYLTQLRSVSITGLSVVTLTFSDKADDYFVRQQVLEKLQNVNLPTGIQPTLAPLSNAVGEIYRYILDVPPEMPLNEIRALQDWVIRPTLRTVTGIADVVSFGGSIKEYQVQINPYLLKKYNITIDQVNQVLNNNSANASGGLMPRGDEILVIRSLGLFEKLEDIAEVTISSRNGQAIHVKDVANIMVGNRERSGMVAYNERNDVVQGIVQMIKGQNAEKIIAQLKEKIAQLSTKLPSNVKIIPIYDRTELVNHTVHTVGENLLVGAALVVIILIVFLRNSLAALIVASVIPLSMLFAFILMDLKGVAANLISLGSVDFGIIIDSAVVLVEAFMFKLAQDNLNKHDTFMWRIQTLKHTAIELGRPILFSKAIIILAFLPIFTFQRVEGKIFSPMTFTLSFALLGAILLTLLWIPTLLSYTLKDNKMAEQHSKWLHYLQEIYRRSLLRSKKFPKLLMSVSVSILVVALSLAPQLGSEFLPKLDEGNIWLTVQLSPSTALEKTKEIEQQLRNILRAYSEVENIITQVGRPDDGTDPKGTNNLEIMATLKSSASWRFKDKESLIENMSEKIREIPGIPTNFSQVIQDNLEEALSGVKGEIAIKIFGTDLDILEGLGDKTAKLIQSINGAADVGVTKINGQTELNIHIDRSRLGFYGINISEINSLIQTALNGVVINTFYENDRRFDVTLRLEKSYRDAVEDVHQLPINLPNNAGTILLGTLATIEVKQGASRISREAGERNVAIKANLLGRDQGSFVAEAMEKVKEQIKLPEGYYMTWGGQFENQQRALKRLQIIVPLSVLMIFILLFWAFKSVKKALLMILMIPFTFIGGLAGLALANLHLSISAAVGFIAVAGISVQNGVIMVEQIVEYLNEGMSLEESVIQGAVQRFRPILMTALMAGLGLLPAALSHGIGSETQRPFAVVIVGGVISATLFTLLLLPLLFPYFSGQDKEN